MCSRVLLSWLFLSLFTIHTQAGVVLWDIWDNFAGDPQALRSVAGYPSSPNRRMVLTNSFASPPSPVNNYGENYATAVRGYLLAPATGDYQFSLIYDDKAEFFLSLDETPTNLQLIAGAPLCCIGAYAETAPSGSVPIFLEKGKFYYFEHLFVEGGLTDYFGVAWKLPDGTFEGPITAKHLFPLPLDATGNDRFDAPPTIITGGYHPLGTNANVVAGQPQTTSVTRGQTAAFEVTAQLSPPALIQWRRNGTPIEGANKAFYSIQAFKADDGAKFDVVITNSFGSVTSLVATLNVSGDFSITQAVTYGNTNGVDLFFTDKPTSVQAGNVNNYILSNGVARVPVTSAIEVGPGHLRLTAPTPDDFLYTLTIQNLTDVSGTALAVKTASFIQHENFFTRKFFQNIQGEDVASLTNSAAYKSDLPDRVDFPDKIDIYQITDSGPNDQFYGAVYQAYFNPPVSGPYRFRITSDDQSMINFSTDSRPENKQMIAFVPHAYAGTTAPSLPVNLIAGKKYYFEVLYKEHLGADVLRVMMDAPGTLPDTATPLAATWFSRYGHRLGEVRIINYPADAEVSVGGDYQFSAEINGALPYTFQWYKNGEPIPGATNNTYSGQQAGAQDQQAKFTVVASNRFSSAESVPATLKVLGLDVPPLTIRREDLNVVLDWVSDGASLVLEASPSLSQPDWQPVENSSFNPVTRPATEQQRFFRLRR